MYKCSTISAGVSTVVEEVSSMHASLSEVSMELRSPGEFSLGIGAIEVSLLRYTELLPEIAPAFSCAVTIVGEVSPTYASRPEVSLKLRFPRKFSLGFFAIEVSLWRCTELLPEVSTVFACGVIIVGGVSPTYASCPEISLELRSPRKFFHGFVDIKVSLRHCTELLQEVSPVLTCTVTIVGEVSPTYSRLPQVSPELCSPREFSFGFVVIELSLRPRIACFFKSFRAHGGWMLDRRGARSLNILPSLTDLRCRQTFGRVGCVGKIVGINSFRYRGQCSCTGTLTEEPILRYRTRLGHAIRCN